jgi:metallophosphoesterase superfamily enzyme
LLRARPLYPHPALLLSQEQNGNNDLGQKFIAISDLHIGFEFELASKGITIDPNLYVIEIINDLRQLVEAENPDGLILLGDLKSTVGYISELEWDKVPYFFKMISKYTDIHFIPGNHDSNIRYLIPENVNVFGISGMIVSNTLLIHGHSMPPKTRLLSSSIKRIVMGHLHPVFRKKGSVLNGHRVWIYLKVKRDRLYDEHCIRKENSTIDIVVVPTFNKYLYALSQQGYRKSISPLIRRAIQLNAVQEALIMTLDGSLVGDQNMLSCVV